MSNTQSLDEAYKNLGYAIGTFASSLFLSGVNAGLESDMALTIVKLAVSEMIQCIFTTGRQQTGQSLEKVMDLMLKNAAAGKAQ